MLETLTLSRSLPHTCNGLFGGGLPLATAVYCLPATGVCCLPGDVGTVVCQVQVSIVCQVKSVFYQVLSARYSCIYLPGTVVCTVPATAVGS